MRKKRRVSNGEHILSIDPGGTTGLAWLPMSEIFGVNYKRLDRVRWDGMERRLETGTIDGTIAQQAWKVAQGCQRLNVRVMIWESSDHFLLEPRGGKAMRKYALIPIKLAGAFETIVVALNKQDHPIVGVEQTAGHMKGAVKSEVLDELFPVNTFKGKTRHEKDAVRHMVLFLRRMMEGKPFAQMIVNDLGEHV